MRILQSQLMLLLSKKDMYILLGSMFVFLVYIVFESGYYLDYHYQVVYQNDLFKEYLIDSVSFMKFVIVLYGIYLSILARRLHFLDGLFLSRGSRNVVIVTKILALGLYLFLITSILYTIFLTVGTFLTPIMAVYEYFDLYLSLLLFGLFYLLLSYLTVLLLKVFYAPIFILFFYFLGTIFSPYYVNIGEVTMLEKVINFFVNDLIVFQDYTIAPMYGKAHIIVTIVFLFSTIIIHYNKNDIIIL